MPDSFLGNYLGPEASKMGNGDGNPPSRLEDHLGYWLRLVSNQISGSFASALHERGVTVAEWVVARRLFDLGEATSGELAEWSGMTRGAMSKVVVKLERKRWLTRRTRTNDQRSQALALTEEGRAAVPPLAAIADRNDARFFGALSSEERSQLKALLEQLADANRWHEVPVD